MLTHIDKNNLPTMVDVTHKDHSIRMALAETKIQLPHEVKPFFSGTEIHLKKGPVFQTAIIAGTMAAKKTYEVIPFCHQIPIESCKFDITMDEELLVTITCQVKTTYKTGVEMEALHGASVAALAIYDMCKAVSHAIVMKETKLIYKTGGKNTVLDRPTYGLVLTGGKSERMGEPKALIKYHGKAHAEFIRDTLAPFCKETYLSVREGQWVGSELEHLPTIIDKFENAGPIGAMLSAFSHHPDANWIVVACDLIHFNKSTIEKLLANYNPKVVATAFKNKEKEFPEPLCTLYTPLAQTLFLDAFKSDVTCPVKVLRNTQVELISQDEGISLTNINTPEERKHAIH
jgi:cyclic pyranopterin phosphate synthase